MSCFFYGTLMSHAVITRVLCRESDPTAPIAAKKLATLRFRPAVIKGYKRYCVKGAAYPGLLPTGNSADEVLGVLCEGLTESDIYRLDIFEGQDYNRVDVIVDTVANTKDLNPQQTVSTEVYVWAHRRDTLEDWEWDYEVFLREKEESWLVKVDEFKSVDEFVSGDADAGLM